MTRTRRAFIALRAATAPRLLVLTVGLGACSPSPGSGPARPRTVMSPVEDSAGHRARPAESDIASRVKDVICDQFEVSREQLGANASLIDDLHADSLKLVELTLALEQEFEITIPEGEGEKIKTVGDLIAYIEARIERDRGARDRRSPPPAAHDQGAR